MQRKYDFMDLIVAIGLCATIVGGGLLFIVTNGTWQARTPAVESTGPSSGSLGGMYWVQPALGQAQAIVGQSFLERQYARAVSPGLNQLEGVNIERTRWQNSPFGYLDGIETGAAHAEADHADRVQGAMGRAIINFTQQGIRAGWSPLDAQTQATPPERPLVAQLSPRRPVIREADKDAWSDVPNRSIVAASIALVGSFVVGLFFLSPLPLRRVVDV